MQIVEQSSDRLILHASPWGLRGMGAVFGGVGSALLAGMIAGHHTGDHGAWVGLVVGGAFAVAGIVMLATATDRQIILERATKTARLVRQGGLRQASITEVPFGQIRDVALESSSFGAGNRGNGSTSYRAVFVLRDGSRLPWTTVLTGDIGTQATCVAAARAFGGWDAAAARSGAGSTEIARPTPPPGVPAVPAGGGSIAGALSARAGRQPPVQNLGCVVAMLSLFMLVGAGMAAVQVDRLLVWRPVQATVISSQVIAVRGSKGGTNYRPAVTYSYQVGGRTYTSQSVTIINESRGWSWATGIVARYPAGAQITAYVNPRDPAGAYLVHALSVFPFVFVLIPLLFTGLVLLSARWNARQAALAAAAPVPVLAAQSLAPSKAA